MAPSLDVRLVAVLDPSRLAGRDPVTAARAAQAGGATAIQLRMKHAPAGGLFALTRSLMAAVSLPVYVNDRADVAWAAGAQGVHLGQDDAPAAPLRHLLPRPFRIGLSVGSKSEAEASGAAPVDYWSIGPLYRTATKPDAGAPLGPDGFRALAQLAPRNMPVIAIGGIGADNVAAAIEAGARGAAVISAVFEAPDIERAARAIRDAIDRAGASG